MNKEIIFILSITVICAIAQLSLLFEVDRLQFTREHIDAGQWWRFLTANIVHLSWRHFVMNILALGAMYALFPSTLRISQWAIVLVFCALSVTVGIWVFSPDIHWYVGLSGVLHGLLLTLIVVDYFIHKHWLNILLLLGLMAKLIWEGIMGPLPGSESTAGGPIVVQAHLYGFVGGILVSAYMSIINKNKKLTL